MPDTPAADLQAALAATLRHPDSLRIIEAAGYMMGLIDTYIDTLDENIKITSFTDLHDHCDANEFILAAESKLGFEIASRAEFDELNYEPTNLATAIVDARLQARAATAGPKAGHVMVNLRIDVHNAAAFIQAGRVSLMRKYPDRYTAEKAEVIISTVEEAVSELLIEGWNSLPVDDDVADWGDIDSREFYPKEDS